MTFTTLNRLARATGVGLLSVLACGCGNFFTLAGGVPPVSNKPSVSIRPASLYLKVNGPAATLTATVKDSSSNALKWSSTNTAVAQVSPSGVVTAVGVGKAVITAALTASPSVTDSAAVTASLNSMRIGVNFWNSSWQPSDTYFKTTVTGGDFATATYDSSTHLMSLNPWRPELLADMAVINGPIRFMDIGSANSSAVIHWGDRIQPNTSQLRDVPRKVTISTTEPTDHPLRSNSQLMSYYGTSATTSDNTLWAYEWMIDLCNRTGRDMWVNLPAFADADYITNLAKLINDRLKSDLHVWVEYSNEYWNYISVAYQYSMDSTIYAEFQAVTPNANKYYWSGQWCMAHAIKVWQGFYDVFGPSNTGYGKRLIRVLAGSSNSDIYNNAINTVIYNGTIGGAFNSKYNGGGMVPDVFACAPYIGPVDDQYYSVNNVNKKLDGSQADIAARYRANVDYSMGHYIPAWKTIATKLNVPLVTYEGGSQLDTHAGAWASNPAIQTEYTYHIAALEAAGVVLFNHYTWTGDYGDGSAWGLRSATGNSDASSPKWLSVRAWITGE